jgi:hypothetical protein
VDELENCSTLAQIVNVRIERHEYVLPLVVKKNVSMMSVSSTEAFPTMWLALQLEMPTTADSIPDPKMGGVCWNSGPDTRLDVVASSIHLLAVLASIQLVVVVVAASKFAQLQEILPKASRVLDPYENPVT